MLTLVNKIKNAGFSIGKMNAKNMSYLLRERCIICSGPLKERKIWRIKSFYGYPVYSAAIDQRKKYYICNKKCYEMFKLIIC